jgi:hypothetical protein
MKLKFRYVFLKNPKFMKLPQEHQTRYTKNIINFSEMHRFVISVEKQNNDIFFTRSNGTSLERKIQKGTRMFDVHPHGERDPYHGTVQSRPLKYHLDLNNPHDKMIFDQFMPQFKQNKIDPPFIVDLTDQDFHSYTILLNNPPLITPYVSSFVPNNFNDFEIDNRIQNSYAIFSLIPKKGVQLPLEKRLKIASDNQTFFRKKLNNPFFY